jgi:Domain of unknown function (DUF4168)
LTPGLFTFCAVTVTAAGLLVAPAANAQNRAPSPPSSTAPGPKVTPATIPDKKLDAAAVAVKKVAELERTYQQKLATAPDADKDRLVGEANSAIVKAVTDEGLSIGEFKTILEVAQNDPIVGNKLMQRLQ